jgi:hypothetical protein
VQSDTGMTTAMGWVVSQNGSTNKSWASNKTNLKSW